MHTLTAPAATPTIRVTDTDDPPAERHPLRLGVWLLPVVGALLLWATFQHQPDPSTEFRSWSRFVTTDSFLAQHLGGSILGQALNVIGAASLAAVVIATGRRGRSAVVGFVLAVLGAAGLLAGFGVAAFAQPAIGHLELSEVAGADAVYDDVYGIPTFAVLIGGTVLFSVASVVLARAAGAIDGTPRWAQVLYGASGPLIGALGLMYGPLQTAGSAAALIGGAGLAVAAARAGSRAGSGR